ncbi:hypothetical protein HRbin34_00445 [bacterium HR34]|nr:hypothetical protein HRbin34_00445 [bacterium HR34]
MEEKEIKKLIEEFFEKAGFEKQNVLIKISEKEILVDLKAEDPYILIGKQGQSLLDLQFLLKSLVSKKTGKNDFSLMLDINDYHKKKIDYLKKMANTIADEVSLLGREKELNPMPAFERRIVHLVISQREDVISESVGKEPKRRVVIKPKTSK